MTDTPPVRRHSRKGLVIPFVLVGLLLAAWTGWWFFLVRQIETRLDVQVEAMRQSGWTVQWAERSVTGWPFRARLELSHPRILAPSGQGVAAPALLAEANAYNPDRWVVIAPDGLTLDRADKGGVGVRGRALRLSISHLRDRFPDFRVELIDPVFTPLAGSDPFPIRSAERILFNSRPHLTDGVAATDQMDIKLVLDEARGRDGGPVEGATQQGRLSADLEAVVDGASHLRGSTASGLFMTWARSGGRIGDIRGRLAAGESRAVLTSDQLSVAGDGRLEGTIRLDADKPLPAIAGLARSQSGAVNRVGAAGAAAASAVTGGQGDADITLVFRDGRTWLGPFALAPAPKLF